MRLLAPPQNTAAAAGCIACPSAPVTTCGLRLDIKARVSASCSPRPSLANLSASRRSSRRRTSEFVWNRWQIDGKTLKPLREGRSATWDISVTDTFVYNTHTPCWLQTTVVAQLKRPHYAKRINMPSCPTLTSFLSGCHRDTRSLNLQWSIILD
jgi:hypothetical protein